MFRVLQILSGIAEPVFDPTWLAERTGDLDVVHLQSEAAPADPAQLAAWVLELHRAEVPLVLTVSDPWAADLNDILGLLVVEAVAVLALNEADAQEISRRWGREAEALPAITGGADDEATLRAMHARIYAQLARVRRGGAAPAA